MAKDSIGVIFGKTSSLSFRFAVSDSLATRRGDYIKVWHESDGWTLAQVSTITSSSENFSVDEAVDAAEGTSKIGDMAEHIIADATVIGVRDAGGVLRVPKSPFSPGDKVFKADELIIKQTLGLTRGDVFIGLLDGQSVHVNLDANNLVQKHCSILAKTGAGKSYTGGVILEELLDKGVPLLIIDPHGEYATLKLPNDDKRANFERYEISPKGYASQITVYTPANKLLNPTADYLFRLNGVNLSIKELSQFFSDSQSQNETGMLYEAVSKLKVEKQNYSIEDIIFEVGQNKSKVKWNVINKLETLKETGILSDNATTINELVQDGRASIIDMKGVNPDLQAMIVAKLCTDIFDARKLNTVPPCMLVIEEAHNFCPEKGFERTVSTDILRTIASEGRKFGLGLMVVSQRPARVDKNILSQCNTQIIMKVTNPNDLKAISKGLEGIGSDVEDDIKSLPPGVAMIVSTYIERPILVDIRTRKSKHGGASVPVVKDPLDMTPRVLFEPSKINNISGSIDDKPGSSNVPEVMDISKPAFNSQMIIDNAKAIIESPKSIINKARTIIESKMDSQKNDAQKTGSSNTGSEKIEPPQHHEEIKEQIERKKGKREVSLYRKMFGSRNK
ncbi:MAG: ATP-binding protein [Candidatus Methanoperedens sp.]|nr:ATP-binding protein [Candidatus Methanoperedens sp.]